MCRGSFPVSELLGGFSLIHPGCFCRLKGKSGCYEGSVLIRLNVQIATELMQALPHAAKTDAGSTRTQLQLLFQRYTLTCVLNLDDDAAIFFTNRYLRGIAFGMTMNIRETFLHQPENGNFHLVGHARELRRNLEANVDLAALREAIHVPANGRGKAGRIEQRWVQQVGNGSNLLADLLDQGWTELAR